MKLGYKVKFILEDDGIIFWDGTEHPPAIDNEDKARRHHHHQDLAREPAEADGRRTSTRRFAYMTGKLKVEGSMGVALKLTSMFAD